MQHKISTLKPTLKIIALLVTNTQTHTHQLQQLLKKKNLTTVF